MSSMQQWLELVRDIGLEGTAAVKIIQEQQELARHERLEVREPNVNMYARTWEEHLKSLKEVFN